MKYIVVPLRTETEWLDLDERIIMAFEQVRRLSLTERLACTLLGARKVVEFRHNGVRFHLAHDSGISNLLAAWREAMHKMADDDLARQIVIGPYVD